MSIGSNTSAELKALVERAERIGAERDALGEDLKLVFAESKAAGFDTKILKKVLADRKKNVTPEEREEERALFDLYLQNIVGDLV